MVRLTGGVLIAASLAGVLWLAIVAVAAGPPVAFGAAALAVCLLVGGSAAVVRVARAAEGLTGMVAAGTATAVFAGLLGAMVMEQPSPLTGVSALADLRFGNQPVPVLVVPGRPGWNLVHVDATNAAVGLDVYHMTPAGPRPGTTGVWALVKLPPGNATVLVLHGGASAAIQLRTGQDVTPEPALTGSDGPECASAVLGALIAGQETPLRRCPSQELSPADSAALRGMIGFIAARGMRHVTLVSDTSPRSLLAAKVVRTVCEAHHIAVGTPRDHPGGPVVIVSGWAGADSALNQVAEGQLPSEGTYLGPWLLDEPLLEYPAGQLLPLGFDLQDHAAFSYLETLNRRFPGEVPTEAGYLGWLTSKGTARSALTGRAELYAASTVYFPGESGHAGPQYTWLPPGGISQVSGVLGS